MLPATQLAHVLLRSCLHPGDWVVDATVGHGLDTLFLAAQVGPGGRVFGFDVQAIALESAAQRLAGQAQVTLFHEDHAGLEQHLPAEARGRLAAVMFNLGYLPGTEKETITQPSSTLSAVQQALEMLAPGGVLTLILYPGHAGGDVEAEALRAFCHALPAEFPVTQYRRLNARRSAPELLIVQRAQHG